MANKRGQLSTEERDYIERHHLKKTVEQISIDLRRSEDSVRKYINRFREEGPAPRVGIGRELEKRPEWKNFQEQFTADELKFFKYKYMQFVSQFGEDDITATEEMQIFSLITIDILLGRVLKEQRIGLKRIEELESKLENEQHAKKPAYLAEYSEVQRIVKDCAQRHSTYEMRKSKILEDLKATRDQRVKVVEGSHKSFIGLIKRLMQDEEFRLKAGFEAGAMRMAMAREKDRLQAPHTYIDGTTDQPLLTPETVI